MKLKQSPFAFRFLVRWIVCIIGLWISAMILSNSISYNHDFGVILIAGFVLAIINVIVKPILIFLSLPALLITLGLFMIIINGLTVLLASKLYSSLQITNFWAAVFAGMVIGLINYIVTTLLEDYKPA